MPNENRRTFLKTAGVAVGAAGLTGAGITLAQQDDDDYGDETSLEGWTAFRGGSTRTAMTADSGPTPYATTDWSMDVGGAMRVGIRSHVVEPVLHDGTLYLAVATDTGTYASDGFVAAYDTETGDELWKHTDLPAPKTPTVGDGTLYFGTNPPGSQASEQKDGLFALDAETGETKWSRGDHVEWEDPVLADGRLYTAYSEYSNESGTVALDPETGETVWENSDASGEVCYGDGTLFVTDGTALHADDGSEKWSIDVSGNEYGALPLQTFSDGLVYGTVPGDTGTEFWIKGWSADDGDDLWEFPVVGGDDIDSYVSRVAVADDTVFCLKYHHPNAPNTLNAEQTLFAQDAGSGAPKWSFNSVAHMFGDPVVADGTVYLGGRYAPESEPDPVPINYKAFVYAIEEDGGMSKWSYVMDSRKTASTPVVDGEKIYVPTFEADSQYASDAESELFVLESCDERPDADYRIGDERRGALVPEACIEASPDPRECDVAAGDEITLDGSCSTDPTGDQLTYDWDMDGDGANDNEHGETVTVTVPGCETLQVSLKVTNADGVSDHETIAISAH